MRNFIFLLAIATTSCLDVIEPQPSSDLWTVRAPLGKTWFVSAQTLTPGDGKSKQQPLAKINDAIASASDGDVIKVEGGFYDEQVVVNKIVAIEGAPGLTATVEGAGWTVTKPGGLISGIFFRGNGSSTALTINAVTIVWGCVIERYETGIAVVNAKGFSVIARNRIQNVVHGIATSGTILNGPSDNSGLLPGTFIINNVIVNETAEPGGSTIGAGTIGIHTDKSAVYIMHNLISGFETGIEVIEPENSFGAALVAENLLVQGTNGVSVVGAAAPGPFPFVVVVGDNAVGAFTKSMNLANGASVFPTAPTVVNDLCGAPADGWERYDWGYHPTGKCISASLLDLNGFAPGDIGPFGGLYGGPEFLAPPAHFRVGWVMITDDQSLTSFRYTYGNLIRDFVRDQFEAVSLGLGVVVGNGDLLVTNFDSEFKAAISRNPGNPVGTADRIASRRFFDGRRDNYDFLVILWALDDLADLGSNSTPNFHVNAQKQVINIGASLQSAAAEFGSQNLLGVANMLFQVDPSVHFGGGSGNNSPDNYSILFAHEAVGHQFGVPTLPGVPFIGAGHFPSSVLNDFNGAPEWGVMGSVGWSQDASGNFQLVPPDKKRHFERLMMYLMGASPPEFVGDLKFLTFPSLGKDVYPSNFPNSGPYPAAIAANTPNVGSAPVSGLMAGWGGVREQLPKGKQPSLELNAVPSVVAPNLPLTVHVKAQCETGLAALGITLKNATTGAKVDFKSVNVSGTAIDAMVSLAAEPVGSYRAEGSLSCKDGDGSFNWLVPPQTGLTVSSAVQEADACASPLLTLPLSGSTSGTTTGTSTLGATCGSAGSAPEAVFMWVAPSSGTVSINTCGSGFDTILSVREATCASSAAEVACSNYACGVEKGSKLQLQVSAGKTYFVVVDGDGVQAGAFKLSITYPSNGMTDENPKKIPGAGGGFDDFVCVGKTASYCANGLTDKTAIYSWKPANAGEAVISTCGSEFDTSISALNSASFPVPCTDLGCASGKGQRKVCRVDHSGPLTIAVNSNFDCRFHLSVTPPAERTSCGDATEMSQFGGLLTGYLAGSGQYFDPLNLFSTGGDERIFVWTPAADGNATITTCGSGTLNAPLPTSLYVRKARCDAPSALFNPPPTKCTSPDGTSGQEISFQAKAGEVYFIFVDSAAGTEGDFQLSIAPPYHPCNPDQISPISPNVSTSGSTNPNPSAQLLNKSCLPSGSHKVFSWTSPPTLPGSIATVDFCGPGTDPFAVGVVAGSCMNAKAVACFIPNQMCSSNFPGPASFNVLPNTTYYFWINAVSNGSVPFVVLLGL